MLQQKHAEYQAFAKTMRRRGVLKIGRRGAYADAIGSAGASYGIITYRRISKARFSISHARRGSAILHASRSGTMHNGGLTTAAFNRMSPRGRRASGECPLARRNTADIIGAVAGEAIRVNVAAHATRHRPRLFSIDTMPHRSA